MTTPTRSTPVGLRPAAYTPETLTNITAVMSLVNDLPRDGVIVLYGEPGSGRTTLATSLGQKNIIMSCDRGYASLQNFPDLSARTSVVKLKPGQECRVIDAMVQAINAGDIECDNLIIDTMTGLYERKVTESLWKNKFNRDKAPDIASRDDYMWAFSHMRPYLLRWFEVNCALTVICHARYPDPATMVALRESTRPDLGKAVFQLINEECSIMGRTYIEENGKHYIQVKGERFVTAKSWINMPPKMDHEMFIRIVTDFRSGT
jgi:hypothetical protein